MSTDNKNEIRKIIPIIEYVPTCPQLPNPYFFIIILHIGYNCSASLYDISIGVIAGAFATLNIIDGYTQYKMKYFEINIIQDLKRATRDFYIALLNEINEPSKIADGLYICEDCIKEALELLNKYQTIYKANKEYLNKYSHFEETEKPYFEIKKIISDYGKNIYDEKLLLRFIEF